MKAKVKAKVIAIANQKGGAGKTTTTIELASTIKEMGKEVLVIDFDQQKNLSKYCGANLNERSIYDALLAECSISDTIQHTDSFDVIIASDSLSKADKKFVDLEDIFLLSDMIELISDQYDYVLVDNSPARNILLTMAYVAADYVIIPTECDDGSLDGIRAIAEDIKKLREGRTQSSHAEILAIILTKKENTIMHADALESIQDIINALDDNPFIMSVRKSIVVSECKKLKMPINAYENKSNPAEDYRAIAKEVIARIGE